MGILGPVDKSPPSLHIITGPTASGKTDASLIWAEKNNAEIISCDSVCVYRGMDIGSAKPSPNQQVRIKHFGIDLVEPTERYSVIRYIDYANQCIQDIQSRGKNVLIVGGSGFYLAAFFGPITDEIPISEAVIKEVQQIQKLGLEAMIVRLRELEGEKLPSWLDIKNPIRVTKALERRLASDRSLDELRVEFLQKEGAFSRFRINYQMIERDDSELKNRINQRTDLMLKEGLIEESEKLLKLNLDPELPSSRAVGYRATMDWIQSGRQIAMDGLRERINLDTWALVRKQRKWFNRLGLQNKGELG
jgi:tRNA dimethylallyltransferase